MSMPTNPLKAFRDGTTVVRSSSTTMVPQK